jgi:hypothetical protein
VLSTSLLLEGAGVVMQVAVAVAVVSEQARVYL